MASLPSDVAVRVERVHKDFFLPHTSEDSIKRKIINVFDRKGKGVETLHALRGISFDIKKGEFFGILGRNGSGKSTLLKIISDIYRPTKGFAEHQGLLIAFIELGVGFNPELTGHDNIYLNGALLGFSRAEIDRMYDEIVAFSELEKFMDLKLKNYSSGMKVRLGFAVAIQAKADILVLDEVLAVGDAAFQRKCFDYFDQIKKDGTTVVFVSHSMDAVRRYCDRAVLIENGVITASGTANEVADEYNKLFVKRTMPGRKGLEQRWGEGGAEFGEVRTGKDVYTREDETITIRTSVKITSSQPLDLRCGILVQDAKKTNLAGTNSQILQQRLDGLRPSEELQLEWTIANVFKDGKYSVTLAAESPNNAIYDWWDEAASFEVNSEVYTPYVVQPEIRLKAGR
jgi:ABC-2 type transport system ATP-binding protein